MAKKSSERVVTVVQAGSFQEIPFETGMTIAAALTAAGLHKDDSDQVRVNNEVIKNPDQHRLRANDQVVLVGEINGG